MLITSFNEEGVLDETNLVLKSLSILTFICPREDTNTRIRYHENRHSLERMRYNEFLSKYVFVSMVNPIGYTLVAKNLPRPSDRQSIEIDYTLVEEDSFYDYLQMVNVIAGTYSMN
jgi:hypothetical protein